MLPSLNSAYPNSALELVSRSCCAGAPLAALFRAEVTCSRMMSVRIEDLKVPSTFWTSQPI